MRRAASTIFVKARRQAARAIAVCFIVVVGPIVAFAARSHWTFDLASQFRSQYCWGLFAAAVVLVCVGQWLLAGIAATLLMCHAATLLPFYAPSARIRPGTETIRFLSINVRRGNDQHARIVDFVRDVRPEVAIFLEVDDEWELALSELGDLLPHSRVEARLDSRGIAVFSRIPLVDTQVLTLSDDVPAIRATVVVGKAQLNLFGVHPYPPISRRMSELRDRQLLTLSKYVAEIAGERVAIGDFNMTSWSPTFSQFQDQTGLRDTRLGRGVQSTWPAWLPALLRIPIDHCLVSTGLEVVSRRAGPNVGSDHLPIVVELSVNPIV